MSLASSPDTDIRGFELPLWQLEVVSIYDVRKRRDIPIEKYRALFQNQFPALELKSLSNCLLSLMGYYCSSWIMRLRHLRKECLWLEKLIRIRTLRQLSADPKQGLNINMNDLADAEEQDDSRIGT